MRVADRQLNQAIDELQETGEASDETRRALASMANVQFASAIVGEINLIIPQLRTLAAEAIAAGSAIAAAGLAETRMFRDADAASMADFRARKAASDAYIAEAERRAKLGKDQLALENEIARVRKDSLEKDVQLTDDQIKRIAEANLAGNAARSAEGKQAKAPKKTGDDRFDHLTQQVQDRIAAMRIEAEVTGLTYQAQEKRRMALDLEQEALNLAREEARKKGDQDWQNAKLTPEQIARINEMSEAYAQQAEALRQIEEAQGRAESAAQDFYETFKSGMIGALKGAESFRDALSRVLDKLADLALNSTFDMLFRGATGSGGWLTNIFKGLGFREKGGPVRKGQPYIVGEKRPELFVPDQNGRILPSVPKAPTMPALAARGVGATETIRVVLEDDSGRMSAIADRRIQLASGPMLEVSVKQSTGMSRKGLPGASNVYQKRGTI